jgi:hypothetical protein
MRMHILAGVTAQPDNFEQFNITAQASGSNNLNVTQTQMVQGNSGAMW